MAQGKPYPREFSAEVMGLYRMGGRTLARWVCQVNIDEGPAERLTTEK